MTIRPTAGDGGTFGTPAAAAGSAGLDRPALDAVLSLQLLVAWAGEALSDPPRLGWWRTALVDEFGGEDLLRRLAPATYRWAVLEAARLAAKKVDERARGRTSDADQLVSLFRFGFAVDEQLDDRLAELKREQPDPILALPALAPIAKRWDRAAFEAWLSDLPGADYTASPTGRRLPGSPPAHAPDTARMLTAALRPLADTYPAPYFRVGR